MCRGVLREKGAKALDSYIKYCKRKVPKKKMRDITLTKQCKAIFKAIDRDSSGTIERDEVREFDKRGKFFNNLDQDGSGGVSEDEFVKYVLKMQTDRNAQVCLFVRHIRRSDWEMCPYTAPVVAGSRRLPSTCAGSL